MNASTKQILAGDIGGTNTRLICVTTSGSDWQLLAEKSYASADFNSLTQLVERFIAEHNISTPTDAACFAIAGPVDFGVCKVTNLPWVISEQQLQQSLSIVRVKLINDLVAAAYGISKLQETDMLTLQRGEVNDERTLNPDAVVVAAGTGFGVAHLVCLDNSCQVYSSEAGHTSFAPENIQQNELLVWLQKKHAHVSLEMILSGKGLTTIYHFLQEVTRLDETSAVKKAMQKHNPSQVISDNAMHGSDLLCQKTMDMFIDIYGAAVGNMALQYYPLGTVYITGGIAPKIKEKLLEQRFIDAFVNKGLMSSNMKKITIKLILQDKVGLYGALYNA